MKTFNGACSLLQLSRCLVKQTCELNVLGSDAARVMRGEIDRNAIIYVLPFWMVTHFLDRQRGGSHEAEGVNEVGKPVLAVKLSVYNAPVRQFAESGLQLFVRKLVHAFILAIRARWSRLERGRPARE